MNRLFLTILTLIAGITLLSAEEPDSIILSAKKGSLPAVTEAIKAGTDINIRDEHGATALMWSSLRGYREIVAVLLTHKADITLQDDRGQTALHWAAMRGKTDIVKLLIDAGADASQADASGKTPSAAAAENGYYDLSVMIKKAGQPLKSIKQKDAAASSQPSGKKDEQPPVRDEVTPETGATLTEYYPAKTGDSWTMRCVPTGVDTIFYVLEASDKGAVIQCESKRNGKRLDYYRQTITASNDALKVTVSGRDEILLKKPLSAGTKWFVERSGNVFTREIAQTGTAVSFGGKDFQCVIVKDVIPAPSKPGKGAKQRKEVHYHCYAKEAGYLGSKTAAFEKAGDVEHIPSFAEIPSWFLVRQRSAN